MWKSVASVARAETPSSTKDAFAELGQRTTFMLLIDDVDPYFFKQTYCRHKPKRYKKHPDELPESLRYSHFNPKVAAIMASKDKEQKVDVDVTDGVALNKKSLMPEITQSYHNVKTKLDAVLDNDEDSQRFLYFQAHMSAPAILAQLARYLYWYADIRSCIPMSLEYQLMESWKELVADVVVIPRQWQTVSMRDSFARITSGSIGSTRDRSRSISPDHKSAKTLDRPETSKSKTRKQVVPPSATGKLLLPEICETGDDSRSVSSMRKSSVQKQRPAGRSDRSRAQFIDPLRSTAGTISQRSSRRYEESTLSSATPSEIRSNTQLFMSTIQFQLSSKSCEEKGWIRQTEEVSDVEENLAMEWCIHMLRQSIKDTNSQRNLAYECGCDRKTVLRYYGDTREQQLLRYKKTFDKKTGNPTHQGKPPNIPEMYKDDDGRKIMMTTINDGSSTVYYPSRRPAIVMSHAGFKQQGFFIVVYDDSLDSNILGCFTPSGKGCWYHKNGRVRFLSTAVGGMISNNKGSMVRRWKWPSGDMNIGPPIMFQVNDQLQFRCQNCSRMAIKFTCDKEIANFKVSCVKESTSNKIDYEEQLLTTFTFSSLFARGMNQIHMPKKAEKKKKKSKDKVKPHLEEIQKLNLEEGAKYDIDANRDLARLQYKVKHLVDDWMEHYRVAVGLTSPALTGLFDKPVVAPHRLIHSATTHKASFSPVISITPVDGMRVSAHRAPASAPAGYGIDNRSPRARSANYSRTLARAQVKIAQDRPHDQSAGGDQDDIASILMQVAPFLGNTRLPHTSPRSQSSHSRAKSNRSKSAGTHLSAADGAVSDNADVHPGPTPCPIVLRAQLLKQELEPLRCRCFRQAIPQLKDIEYEMFIEKHLPPNQLAIVAIVSSLFDKRTPAAIMLENVHVSQNRNRSQPCQQAVEESFRIFKYDTARAAEGSDHTQPTQLVKHNVVPGMFLIYQGGKLLFCDHIFNGYGNERRDFQKQIIQCRYAALNGVSLPNDFRFSPARGRLGMRSAWGGQIGGTGVDHYGNPGTSLTEMMGDSRPGSSSTSTSEIRLQEFTTGRLRSLESPAKYISTSLSPTGYHTKLATELKHTHINISLVS